MYYECTLVALNTPTFLGKTRMEPLAILVLSVIMSSASGMVIIRSAEQIQVCQQLNLTYISHLLDSMEIQDS